MSINHDPDIAELTWAQRGILTALEALASQLDPLHAGGSDTGPLDTVERTAWHIRCELGLFEESIEALKAAGLIHEIDGILYVTKYGEQQRPPSEQIEATRERQKLYRERKKADESVTRDKRVSHGTVTPLDQIRRDQNRGDQRRGDQKENQTGGDSEQARADLRAHARRLTDSDSAPPVSDSGLTLTDFPEGAAELIREALEWRDKAQGEVTKGKELEQMLDWAEEYGAQAVRDAAQKAWQYTAKNPGGYMRTVLESDDQHDPEVAVGPRNRWKPQKQPEHEV